MNANPATPIPHRFDALFRIKIADADQYCRTFHGKRPSRRTGATFGAAAI